VLVTSGRLESVNEFLAWVPVKVVRARWSGRHPVKVEIAGSSPVMTALRPWPNG
jgi:hypothetical protein